jgi:hypothetical protein
MGTAAVVAGGAAGAAAIANRGGNPRVQVVGQNVTAKPQPLPLRAAGAQVGNTHVPAGPAANANGMKPGTAPTVNGRTLPAQTNTTAHGQVRDRTVTRGNEAVGKGTANGNANANGLPSSGFAPHKGPPTSQTSTPRTVTTTPNNNTRQLDERKAVTGRTQTPASTTSNTVHKAPVDTNDRPATVHRSVTPTDTSVQSHARTTTQGNSMHERRVTPPTGNAQQQVESKTVNPQRQYTPRTAPVEHAPQTQVQVQHAPQTQVQHAPPPPVERRAPPPQRQTNERKKEKDKDDDNGHH